MPPAAWPSSRRRTSTSTRWILPKISAGRGPAGGTTGWANASGIGLRQPPDGDRRWVPWVNAPPGTQQHLGVFYLVAATDAAGAYRQVRAYTHDDAYIPLPGYKTFTSHYHIEHTYDLARQMAVEAAKVRGVVPIPADLVEPSFVKAFKKMGVNIVHLAEFHDGKPRELADQSRLQLMRLMHEECARLSGGDFLLLPGEEPNVHLGGHWISLFPHPVYWTLDREKGQPFLETIPGYARSTTWATPTTCCS